MERPLLLLENLPQVTFDDAAIYFSEEQWQNLEDFQKKIYKELIKEIYETMVALGYRIPKPEIVSRIERGEEPCIDSSKKSKLEMTQVEGSKDAEPAVKVERESPEASIQIPPSEISSSQERNGAPCPRCGMRCNNQCGMSFQWNMQGMYPGPPMDAGHRKPYMPPSPTFFSGGPVSPSYHNRGEGMPHPTSPMAGYGNAAMVPLSPHYPGYRDPNTTFPFPERPGNPGMFGGFEVNQPTAMGPPASHMPAPDHEARGRKDPYLQAREAAFQERRSQVVPCPACGTFCNNQCGANFQWEQRRLHHGAPPGPMETNRYTSPPNPYFNNNGPNPSVYPNVRPPLRHGTPPVNVPGNPAMMQFPPQFPGYRRPGDPNSPNILHGKPELSPGHGLHGGNSVAGSPQGLNQGGKYGVMPANSVGNHRKPQSMSPLASDTVPVVSPNKNLNSVSRPPAQTVTSSDLSRGPPPNANKKPDNSQHSTPGGKMMKGLGTATPPVGNTGQSAARNAQSSFTQSQDASRVTTGEGLGVKRPAPQQPSESRPPLKRSSPAIIIVDCDDEKPASSPANAGNRQIAAGTPTANGGSRQSAAGTPTANGGSRQSAAGTHTANGGSWQTTAGTPTANGGGRQSAAGTPTANGGSRQSATGGPTVNGGNWQSNAGAPMANGGSRQSSAGTPTAIGGSRQSSAGTPTANGDSRQSSAGTPTGKRTPMADGGTRQSNATIPTSKSGSSLSDPIVVEDCEDFPNTQNQDGKRHPPPITISSIRTSGIFHPPVGKKTSCPIIFIDDADIDGVIVQTERSESSVSDTTPIQHKLAIEPAPPPPPVTKVQPQVTPQVNKVPVQSPIIVTSTSLGNQPLPVNGNPSIMLTFPVTVGSSGIVLATPVNIADNQTNRVPVSKNPRLLQPSAIPINVTSGNANAKLGAMTVRPVIGQPTGIAVSVPPGQAKPFAVNVGQLGNGSGPFNLNNGNFQKVNGVPVTAAGGQPVGQSIPLFVDPKSGLILTGTAVPSKDGVPSSIQNATVVTVNGGMVPGNVAPVAMGGNLAIGNIAPVNVNGLGTTTFIAVDGPVGIGNNSSVTLGSKAPLNMNNPTILTLNGGLGVGRPQPVGGPIANFPTVSSTSVPAVLSGQQNSNIIIRKVGEPGTVPQNPMPSLAPQNPPPSDDLSLVVVERLFNCSECAEKFNSLENLTSHQAVHKRPDTTLGRESASKDSGDVLPGGADDDSPTILYTTQGDDGSTVYVVTV